MKPVKKTFLPPANLEPEIPKKKQKKKEKPYKIEWRRTQEAFESSTVLRFGILTENEWTTYNSYATDEDREKAMKALPRKYEFWEFRKAEDVEVD